MRMFEPDHPAQSRRPPYRPTRIGSKSHGCQACRSRYRRATRRPTRRGPGVPGITNRPEPVVLAREPESEFVQSRPADDNGAGLVETTDDGCRVVANLAVER